jgi:hypothetical protein
MIVGELVGDVSGPLEQSSSELARLAQVIVGAAALRELAAVARAGARVDVQERPSKHSDVDEPVVPEMAQNLAGEGALACGRGRDCQLVDRARLGHDDPPSLGGRRLGDNPSLGRQPQWPTTCEGARSTAGPGACFASRTSAPPTRRRSAAAIGVSGGAASSKLRKEPGLTATQRPSSRVREASRAHRGSADSSRGQSLETPSSRRTRSGPYPATDHGFPALEAARTALAPASLNNSCQRTEQIASRALEDSRHFTA